MNKVTAREETGDERSESSERVSERVMNWMSMMNGRMTILENKLEKELNYIGELEMELERLREINRKKYSCR